MLHGKYQWQFVAQSGNERRRETLTARPEMRTNDRRLFSSNGTSVDSDTAIIIPNLNSLEMMREAERWSVCEFMWEYVSKNGQLQE